MTDDCRALLAKGHESASGGVRPSSRSLVLLSARIFGACEHFAGREKAQKSQTNPPTVS